MPCGFEFFTYQAESQKPSPEGVFFVCALGLSWACAPLYQGLIAYCEAKLYICLYFSCVGRSVEKSKFYRAFLENAVQVQPVVAAAVVVHVAVFGAVWCVPNLV